MASNAALLLSIKQVLIDLRSDKTNVRANGLQSFHSLFDNRSSDLSLILRPTTQRRNGHDEEDDLFTWTNLFDELNSAIREQCQRIHAAKSVQSQKSLVSKNDEYKEALRKCINVANEQIPNVAYKKICHAAFDCFETPAIAMFYDALYLQIIYKHILNAKHSISELLVADWSRLLSIIFGLLNRKNSQIQKLELLQCIPLILLHAAKYTYLVSDLDQYLPNIVQIVNEGQLQNQINAQKQIFLIVHEFVRNLAVNRRSAIVSFTDRILDKLLKLYQFTMDTDSKVILFKIMHISVVVHHPEPKIIDEPRSIGEILDETSDLFKQNIADDIQLWHKHLRNMLSVIEREIIDSRKRNLRLNPNPVICPIFVRMAAKLCSVVFWRDDIWNSSRCDEQQQKKRRHSMMLEKLMELVEYERGKFCWRWFAILSQLIVDFPHVLQVNDYQALLDLLLEYKSTIQHPLHMEYFIRMAAMMLRKEHELQQSSNSFCVERWHKIMELSFKQAETDKTQLENVDLMRVLIDNKVIVSHNFVKNIIIAIAKTQTIRKSNSSIRLLMSVLQNVNVDMIDDISNLKKAIIHWLTAKIKLSELRKVIENNNTIEKRLVAELSVLCALSRQESTRDKMIDQSIVTEVHHDDSEINEHMSFIDELVQCLQYRMLSKLVVNHTKHSKWQSAVGIEKLPEPNEVKASLNESINTELEKAIGDANSADDIENSIESFNSICTSLATNVNILNSRVGYESIDGDNFLKFLTKRILFSIGKLNGIIKNVGNSYRIESNPNDVNGIVDNLLDIWHIKYHPIVTENIFVVKNSASIITWLKAQLIETRRPASILMAPLKGANQLEFEQRIQLKCLTLLAHFSAYQEQEQENSLNVFEAIETYSFNYERNEDLYILLQLAKIILNQQCPSEQQTEWAFEEILQICKIHQTHHEYIDSVVDYIPAMVKCVKPYVEMHDNLITLISTILKRCKSKKLSRFTCLKMIRGVEYFAQEFFNVEDGPKIIKFLLHFLRSEYFTIQIATVSSLTSIFDKYWLSYNEDEVNCLVVQQFHMDLAECLEIDGLSVVDQTDIDRKACTASTRIQLYCSIIGMCYALRKEMWFKLVEFCTQNLKLNEEKIYEIVEKLCVEVFNSSAKEFLADLIPHLIGLWIDKNYLLINFPTKLSVCKTKNDFIPDFSDIIILRIIQFKSEYIPDLLQIFETDSLSKILTTASKTPSQYTILIKCLAWLTSVNCKKDSPKAKGVEMLRILRKEKPNIEQYFESHSLEIIEELFNNVWDAKKFTELFEIDVEYVTDGSTIDINTFFRSLEYIQQKSSKPSNVIHHFCAVAPRKVINMLYALKLHFQQSVCEEQKLTQLFRVCTLIEIILGFINEFAAERTHSNTIGFFIRDFIHFFGNVISNSSCANKLKLATCKYFQRFCEQILPECAPHFQSHLNYTVSILLPITKTDSHTKIVEAGMALLQFLIAEQTAALQSAIGELDNFPMRKEFDELRKIQHDVKYNGKSFTLLDEIEYFLTIDKRKVEGLLSLKEHLSKKKKELQEIYKTIYDTRGFSEDCEKSPIHRLISTLLSHIVQNVDSEKSLIAAKCLGELGPNDLGSIALQFDHQAQTYKICESFEEAITNVCEHALEKLNGIFVHSDATVLQAAADACKHMLESQTAVSLLNKYPLLSVFETGAGARWPLKQIDKPLDLTKLFNDDAFSETHSYWVKRLAIELFTLFDGESLAQVASKQTQFSVSMIPLLVKALLMTKNKAYHDSMNAAVDLFFSKNFEKLSTESMEVDNESSSSSSSYVYLDKVSIKLMLNVAECIRVHNQNSKSKDRLKLNYLHIAKAALHCEAYFTTILYGELISHEGLADGDLIETRSIMKSAYQSIGEMDAVSAYLDPINHKMEYLELNRCWDQILIGCDAQSNDLSQCARYLGRAGLYNLANKLTNGNNSVDYECAWRLADWNIVEGGCGSINTQSNDLALEFEKYHYFALKNLKKRDQIGVKINVENAFKAVIRMFKQSSYECTKNIYKNLMMLHLLQQIDEFCHIQFSSQNDEIGPEFIMNKWNYQDQVSLCGFNYREPILAQRIIMVQSAGIRAARKIENVGKFGVSLRQMILNLIAECREEGFFNLGERYSATLHKMQLSGEMKAHALIEDAQLSWSRGEGEMTKHMINAVIKDNRPTFSYAKALWMMGEYLADARLEDTKTIIDKYFTKSVSFSSNLKKSENIPVGSAYYYSPEDRQRLELQNKKRNYQAIAKYADREYQQIAAYKKSTEFVNKLANIKQNKAITNEMQQRGNTLTKDEQKSHALMSKTIKIDESDVKSTNTEYEQYLQIAVEYYIQTLLLENENEMCSSAMFRLFGLWFSNLNSKDISKEIEENYKRIATHKFIALMPQITTHLSTDGIKDVIEEIVSKCAKHHPYHVLPKVLALFNAFKDDEFLKDAKQKSKPISSSPRTDAAGKLLQKLKGDGGLRDIIVQMERMCEVLIRTANTDLGRVTEFSGKDPIRNLRDLDLVHCPTVELPVRISGDYSHSIVGISKWKSGFCLTAGINKPKRIECVGLNGKTYSQLLKGTDDLRQDSVMQQVFGIMNNLLDQSKTTKKDRLHIRTYVVVPLSQRSGILEWCVNTMPLTDYLVGSTQHKGAHERFRPQDWPPHECRRKMSQVPIRTTKFEDTLSTYQSICKNIQPVFHHFFFEHFYNPGVWFERRMAYAHSLATTSMIGYVLGIGDRHVSNILIDKTTAEMIHIDFGIAFEQGKCLPTPELIPFRLTRDLVSALGPTGVEGVYRKSCEKTMEVLRQNKSTILTIVEVLLHDPLYAWTLSSSAASKRQQTSIHIDEDQDMNTMAERALWRLEEKLDGKHVSRSESISVKRHVEILIKEATNKKLLCRLFVGWQPYL